MSRMDPIEIPLRRRTDPQQRPIRNRRLGLLARWHRFRLYQINRDHRIVMWGFVREGREL